MQASFMNMIEFAPQIVLYMGAKLAIHSTVRLKGNQ